MDFPSTCYKVPACGEDSPPSHVAVPSILHNKQKQLMFWPVRRRIPMLTLPEWGAGAEPWAGFPYKAQESRGGLQRSVTPWVQRLMQYWQGSGAKKSFVGSGADTIVHVFCSFRVKNLKLKGLTFFGFFLSGISDWSFHLRLASMEASWTKGSMHWFRHNRIYWLLVNWLKVLV